MNSHEASSHASHVIQFFVTRAMYDYVGLCMAMYGYVGLCIAMYGYVWLCRAMYSYV